MSQVLPVPDHGRVSLAELQASDRRPVLMTEKDAVKYVGLCDQDVWYVPVHVEIASKDVESMLTAQVIRGCGLANTDG